MQFTRRSVFWLIGCTLTLVICVAAYRQVRMFRLFQQATDLSADPNQQLKSVRELASHRGGTATFYLLKIALGYAPLQSPETRELAIRALAKRGDPEIAISLAGLLQPHVAFALRDEAAAALMDHPCPEECAKSVLHYLERIWSDPNAEEPYPIVTRDPMYSEEREELYKKLCSVLRRDKGATLQALITIYGLGSSQPSRFAIHIVDELHLTEACSLLQKAFFPPVVGEARMADLKATYQHLECPPPQIPKIEWK